ncbi:MAG: hypothetical protein FJZ00_03335, partial [Candidatus Sericytochromatia bacterium]|nr:hypothetical protein [Candidatus Tanganyikabacteria bacterium]
MAIDLALLAPEILVTFLALAVIAWDWVTKDKRILGHVSLFGLIVTSGVLIGQMVADAGT